MLVDTHTWENGAVSDSDLASILGTSKATVNRIRHDLKYSYRPLRHAPRLTDRHIQNRLAFCIAHQNEDWSNTLFTDESRFATSPDSPVKWWTKRGENLFLEEDKFPASIMVWAGIVGGQKRAYSSVLPEWMLKNTWNFWETTASFSSWDSVEIVPSFNKTGLAVTQQHRRDCGLPSNKSLSRKGGQQTPPISLQMSRSGGFANVSLSKGLEWEHLWQSNNLKELFLKLTSTSRKGPSRF